MSEERERLAREALERVAYLRREGNAIIGGEDEADMWEPLAHALLEAEAENKAMRKTLERFARYIVDHHGEDAKP